jgi:hypothetical protein
MPFANLNLCNYFGVFEYKDKYKGMYCIVHYYTPYFIIIMGAGRQLGFEKETRLSIHITRLA